MRPTSVLAIYLILWFLCLFFILPLRLRRHGVEDRHVPGQADSAPPAFSFARTAFWTSAMAAAVMALFAINYQEGWLTVPMLEAWTG